MRCDLVLSGPGPVAMLPLAGAVAALGDAGYEAQRLLGVSGGAPVAALLAASGPAGEPAQRVAEVLRDLDLARLVHRAPRLRSRLFEPPRYRLDAIEAWLQGHLEALGVRTFGDLRSAEPGAPTSGDHRLTVLVQDAPRRTRRLPLDLAALGYAPDDFPVALAVTAALSGPQSEPVDLPIPSRPSTVPTRGAQETPESRRLTDAFAVEPLPLGVLDRQDGEIPRWPTFGVLVTPSGPNQPRPQARLTPTDRGRTIVVELPPELHETFDLSPEGAEQLFQQGREAAETFLRHWDFSQWLQQGAPAPHGEGPSTSDQPPEPQVTASPPVPAPPAPSLVLAGYAADTAAGADRLGIREDVESLCTVLLAEGTRPPLSVGLFGDWGSGKSFFMQKMRERIDEIADDSRRVRNEGRSSDFCENVRQVTFNAWHYVDANLWASLVTRIFDGIIGLDEEPAPLTDVEREQVEARRDKVLGRLHTAELLRADATRRRADAERRLAAVTRQRQESADRLSRVSRRTAAQAIDVLRAHPDLLQAAAVAVARESGDATPPAGGAGAPGSGTAPNPAQVAQLATEVTGTLGAVRHVWRSVRPRDRRRRALALGLVAAVVVLVAVLAQQASLVAGAVPLLAGLGALVRFGPQVGQVRRAARAASEWVDRAVAEERQDLEQRLATLQAQARDLERRRVEADLEVDQVRQGQRVLSYIETRVASADYDRHLGVLAMVRKDLARLSALMDPAALPPDRDRIDRIVLYVDDLDRCPAKRVVEVLQAVHLLLAFPLFVVVVGVDVRWLLRSLELEYREVLAPHGGESGAEPDDVLHWAATPQNYLDKIIQIPLTLRPMTEDGFADLVREVAGAATVAATAAGLQVDDRSSTVPEPGPGTPAPAAQPHGGGVTSTAARPLVPDLAALAEAQGTTSAVVPGQVAALTFGAADRSLVVLTTGETVQALRVDVRDGQVFGSRLLSPVPRPATLAADGSRHAWVAEDQVHADSVESPGRSTARAPAQEVLAVSLTADGNLVAYATPRHVGVLSASGPVGELEERRFEDAEAVTALPAGAVVVLRAGRLCVLDASGQSRELPVDRVGSALSATADGQLLAAASPDELLLVRVDDGEVVDRLATPDQVTAVSFSRDGRRLAVAVGADVVVLDVDSSEPLVRARHPDGAVAALAFGAQGRMLAGAAGSRVQVWALAPAADLAASNLDLTPNEVEFLEGLLPLIRTPRAVKRLVNLYRLLRAPLQPVELERLLGGPDEDGDHPAVLLLLAMLTGFPDQGAVVVGRLLTDPQPTWDAHVAACARAGDAGAPEDPSPTWQAFSASLRSVPQQRVPEPIEAYQYWAPRVARFSFRATHAGRRDAPPADTARTVRES